jgi:GT2 family glycosyltransferase
LRRVGSHVRKANWVIVTYGSVKEAAALIDSVPTDEAKQTHFVLCCNKPGDADEAGAIFAQSEVSVIAMEDNPGYLPAFDRIRGQLDLSVPTVFGNSDLVLETPFLSVLEEASREYPDVGVLAPAILGAYGIDQNPYLLQPPTQRQLRLARTLHRHALIADLVMMRQSSGPPSRRDVAAWQLVWAGHGSCMILTPEFFARGGRTDYPFFLFAEELWIGAEAARIGVEVRYVPSMRLRHSEHASIGTRRRGRVAQAKYDGLRYWARRAGELGWQVAHNRNNHQ